MNGNFVLKTLNHNSTPSPSLLVSSEIMNVICMQHKVVTQIHPISHRPDQSCCAVSQNDIVDTTAIGRISKYTC